MYLRACVIVRVFVYECSVLLRLRAGLIICACVCPSVCLIVDYVAGVCLLVLLSACVYVCLRVRAYDRKLICAAVCVRLLACGGVCAFAGLCMYGLVCMYVFRCVFVCLCVIVFVCWCG